jgi:hypothetical protein
VDESSMDVEQQEEVEDEVEDTYEDTHFHKENDGSEGEEEDKEDKAIIEKDFKLNTEVVNCEENTEESDETLTIEMNQMKP